MTQAASDILLGWLSVSGLEGVEREYYVRQLWDQKGSFEIETMSSPAIEAYARAFGSTLARAHARTGDPIGIAGYLGKSDRFDRAVADFASAYAEQNQNDHEALSAAVRNGDVVADTNPLG